MKPTRIIFLDDEPQTSTRLKDILVSQGFEVVVPKTIDEAFYEVNHNGVELLIHSAHKTKTYWNLCEEFFNRYPYFSSIHFATGPGSENFLKMMKGPFHHKMRSLIPEREFLKRVKKLIYFSKMRRENIALRKTLRLHKHIDKMVGTLDIDSLKKHFVDFFKKEFRAENAYFLSPGSYGYFIQEMWKVSALNGVDQELKKNKHKIISAEICSEQEITDVLQTATEYLPTGWELHRNKVYLERQDEMKSSLWIVPIIGHESSRIYGHIVVTNPQLYGEPALMNSIPHIFQVLGRHFEHVNSFSDAKSLSYIDDLTDLYNQRYLRLVLDKEIARSQRVNSCFSVLFMDIDHFKRVNDSRGHLIGSKLLVALSQILHRNIRTSDYGFRYGGDEFILILVGTGSEDALFVAERIRKEVEESTFDVDGQKIKMTLSVGIATYPDHASTRDQIIELADKAMYCGKSKSRNVVYVAS